MSPLEIIGAIALGIIVLSIFSGIMGESTGGTSLGPYIDIPGIICAFVVLFGGIALIMRLLA